MTHHSSSRHQPPNALSSVPDCPQLNTVTKLTSPPRRELTHGKPYRA